MSVDKRKEPRFNAFWKVYKNDFSWGYLLDISENGLRVWLNKDEIVDDESFDICIHTPYELEGDSMDFNIKQVWTNSDRSHHFNELGCQFNELNEDQKKYLNTLIEYFRTYNEQTIQI